MVLITVEANSTQDALVHTLSEGGGREVGEGEGEGREVEEGRGREVGEGEGGGRDSKREVGKRERWGEGEREAKINT